MKIDYPQSHQLPQLWQLWQEAFGDSDAFLHGFFDHIFSPDRCRCVTVDGDVAAMLYWFDCRSSGQPVAYLYAIATAKKQRGKGLCRSLITDTHALLERLGYAGCLLVPEPHLFQMYAGMGYLVSSGIQEFSCKAAQSPASIREISTEEYAALRRQYLPEGGVIQEGENLVFLAQQVRFYAGDDCLFCARIEGAKLFCPEILGSTAAAPEILYALGASTGSFRTPGTEQDFAMYHPLSELPAPSYFGLAFD